MAIEINEVGFDRLADFVTPIATAAGFAPTPEALKRWEEVPEFDLRLVAVDGDAVVGAAGSFTYDMTTPGGSVATAGLTMVAVLPTHRRRGILTRLMRRYLDVARERSQPVSALWASEGHIYRRFGYGVAALSGAIDIDRAHAIFADPAEPWLRAHIVSEDEAMRSFPEVWERARAGTPGMLSRSEAWWRHRRLGDEEWQRRGRGALQRVLFERDDRADGYALYRHSQSWENFVSTGTLDVLEAVGGSWDATRAVWRYLLDMDWVARIKASLLPVDHPLLLLMAEPRRLGFRLQDSLWIRLVDVEHALAARGYSSDASLVFELSDPFCSWNEGCWRLEHGRASKAEDEPELRLDATALGGAYLGGFSFSQLHRAGRVEELRKGALEQADALFAADRAPWCPEIF